MMYRSRRRTMIVQPIPGIIYPRLLQMLTTLLAQMRSADRVRKRLLLGVDRTYCGRHETDAFDPGPANVGGASLRAPFVIPKARQR